MRRLQHGGRDQDYADGLRDFDDDAETLRGTSTFRLHHHVPIKKHMWSYLLDPK